jgi:hypothetical protein
LIEQQPRRALLTRYYYPIGKSRNRYKKNVRYIFHVYICYRERLYFSACTFIFFNITITGSVFERQYRNPTGTLTVRAEMQFVEVRSSRPGGGLRSYGALEQHVLLAARWVHARSGTAVHLSNMEIFPLPSLFAAYACAGVYSKGLVATDSQTVKCYIK